MFFDFSLFTILLLVFCLKTVGACWDDPKKYFFESYDQLFSKSISEKLFSKTFPAFNIFQMKFLLKKKVLIMKIYKKRISKFLINIIFIYLKLI